MADMAEDDLAQLARAVEIYDADNSTNPSEDWSKRAHVGSKSHPDLVGKCNFRKGVFDKEVP